MVMMTMEAIGSHRAPFASPASRTTEGGAAVIEDIPTDETDDKWMDRYTLRGRLAAWRYRFRRTTRKKQAMGCGAIVGFCAGAAVVTAALQFLLGG